MSTAKDLDRLLRSFLEKKNLPGASLSVCRGEEVLYENYLGSRDMAGETPMGPETLFRIHSITKAVSALCGMMEFERGAFLMDDPVSAYLPDYKELKLSVKQPDGSWAVEDSKTPMLMRHLFNMNVGFYAHDGSPTETGLRDIHEQLGGSKFQAGYSLGEEIRALAKVPMLFEPGSRWQYGYGISIMGAVVEVTSGLSLGRFMEEKVFAPLGMKDTGFRFRPGWRERMAECVMHKRDGSVVKCESLLGDPLDSMYREEGAYEAPDAGLISTVRDIQTFSGMLACGGTWKGEKIIGRKTLEMMRQNLLTADMLKEFRNSPEMKGYGYGYGVRTLMDPVSGLTNGSAGEFGWEGAAGAWMMADPVDQLSASFMIQDMLPDAKYYNDRLRSVIYGLL